jgi:hypothetical protein
VVLQLEIIEGVPRMFWSFAKAKGPAASTPPIVAHIITNPNYANCEKLKM